MLTMRRTLHLIAFTPFFLALNISLFAQDPPTYTNLDLVQPEVWQFARPPEAGVDAYGDMSMSIPVMTVPGRGMNYDITFSYRSGISVFQPASWVGLGWSFDPGSISREPEGVIPGGMYGVDLYDVEDTDGAAQPDRFYASLPQQGSIEFTQSNFNGFSPGTIPSYQTGDFVPNQHKPWNIEGFLTSSPSLEVGDCAGASNCRDETGYQQWGQSFQQKKDYEKFVIKSEDGTRYIFESPTLAFFETVGGGTPINAITRQAFVNTWRLVAILSSDYEGPDEVPNLNTSTPPEGKWVAFKYSDVIMEDGDDQISSTVFDSFTQTRYLEYIITPTHYAEFFTSTTTGPVFDPADYRWSTDLYKQLDNIELRRGWYGQRSASDPIVERVYLEHDVPDPTNTLSDFASPFAEIALGQCTTAAGGNLSGCQGRLMLWELRFFGMGGTVELDGHYAFSYAPDPNIRIDFDEANPIQDRAIVGGKRCIDSFGYLSSVLVTDVLGCLMDDITGAGTDDFWGGEAWSLTRVDFPTGGHEAYEYQTDIMSDFEIGYDWILYFDETSQIFDDRIWYFKYDFTNDIQNIDPDLKNQGGARVTSITRGDGMGNTYVTNYEYGPGKPTGVPIRIFEKVADIPSMSGNNVKTIFAPSNRGKLAVIYDTVTRVLPNGTKIEVEYVTPTKHGGEYVKSVALQNGQGNTQGLNALTVLMDNRHWSLGQTKKTTYYDNATTPNVVKTVEHDLEITQYQQVPITDKISSLIWSFFGVNEPDDDGGFEFVSSRNIHFVRPHINSTTETSYDSGIAVASTTTFTYDPQTNLPTHTTTASQDHTLTKEIRYAHREHAGMEAKNMLSQQYSNAALAGGTLRQKSWTTWSESSGAWRPSEAWVWTSTGNPEDPGASDDKVFTYASYNNHGSITSTIDAAGTTTNYGWGHDDAVLTSITSIAANGGTLTSAATYEDDRFLMTSLTTVNNVTTYYSYDDLARLETIKENSTDATAVTQYIYGIQGNNLSATNPNYIDTILNNLTVPDQISRTYLDGLAPAYSDS